MVPSIAALGRKCAHALIKHGVMEKLCELLVAKHMASPLKLLSLKAVDSLLDFPQGIERFLGWTELQVCRYTMGLYDMCISIRSELASLAHSLYACIKHYINDCAVMTICDRLHEKGPFGIRVQFSITAKEV